MFALETPWTIYFIFKKIIFISIYIRLTQLKRNTYTVIHKCLVYYNKTWKNRWLHFIKASVVQKLWCGWCLLFKWQAFSYNCSELIKHYIWLPPKSHFQFNKPLHVVISLEFSFHKGVHCSSSWMVVHFR